jgi:hypothetical protein
MMKRHIQILTILLIIQIGLTAIAFWPRSAETSEVGTPLLGDITSESIRQIEIEDGDGDTITLANSEDGWVIPELDNFPVLAEKVDTLIAGLLEIRTDRLITRTESSHRQLKVASDEFERKIILSSGETSLRTVYIGSSPSFGSAHVRLEGEEETYLTNAIAAYQANADAASWIDTVYQRVAAEDIQAIRLENANGTWDFEKDEEGNWSLAGLGAGEELNASTMSTIETRATSISMTEPLGMEVQESYGLDEPQSTLVIETEEKTITLLVGAYDEESDTYVVSSSESPYYVRVSAFTANPLVEDSSEEFITLLPTPTPEVEAEAEGTDITDEDAGSP